MKAAIITVAGVSSRFNQDIPENEKVLKAIYYEKESRQTLLYHMIANCSFADRIIIVGGYQFDALKAYLAETNIQGKDRIVCVYNEHYADLASGYSLYLGLCRAFEENADEILFAEGDLDVDRESFERVAGSSMSMLTYNGDPIYASKAVVLYKKEDGRYKYAFNSDHGLLSIPDAFSCILNSGQVWKFTDMEVLKKANDEFVRNGRGGTNLSIIQKYLDSGIECGLTGFNRWTNCNTRNDYRKIVLYWEGENK